jgi:putative SbcD/Mre11-related phosphoesterase
MRVHDDWLLTPQRAAVHVPTATAVIADVHAGYGEARRRRGEAVPLTGLSEVFAVLRPLFAAAARRLVIAGDLFEEGYRPELAEEFLGRLSAAHVELLAVVPGNHDRGLAQAGCLLPVRPEGVSLGSWRVVHGDGSLPEGRLVHGHFHPGLRVSERLLAPCFLVGQERIVLPALSADAAGGNVLGQRRWKSYRCCVPAGERVLDFGELRALRRRAIRNR